MEDNTKYRNEMFVYADKPKKRSKLWIIVVILLLVLSFLLGVLFDKKLGSVLISDKGEIFDQVYEIMKDHWYQGKDIDDLEDVLMNGALNGMVDAGGDIHTYYMNKDEVAAFWSSLDNELVGVGISYQLINGNALVREVLVGSPAESFGVLAGDLIEKVDGISIEGKTIDEIGDMVKGEEGTKVTLGIKRGPDNIDISVVRGKIYTSVSSRVANDVGIVKLNSFSNGTPEELKTHLDRLRDQGIEKLVIDLRGNGGGYLDVLQKVASYFLDRNTVVLIESFRDGKTEEIYTSSGRYAFNNIVLVQDNGSASCTEVFAAALREHEGIKIVGETSYGKGTVQVTHVFGDGSAIKYTDAQWLTPSGKSIEKVGVEPDYEVKLDDALYLSTDLAKFEDGIDRYELDSVSAQNKGVQLILKFLGYDIKRVDGYFDQNTLTNLKKFEEDKGYEIKEYIDEELMTNMFMELYRTYDQNKEVLDKQLLKALEIING